MTKPNLKVDGFYIVRLEAIYNDIKTESARKCFERLCEVVRQNRRTPEPVLFETIIDSKHPVPETVKALSMMHKDLTLEDLREIRSACLRFNSPVEFSPWADEPEYNPPFDELEGHLKSLKSLIKEISSEANGGVVADMYTVHDEIYKWMEKQIL